jgi:hypothetical protein
MLTALIGIQTVTVITTASYIMKHIKTRNTKVKLFTKSNGFKHYKTF